MGEAIPEEKNTLDETDGKEESESRSASLYGSSKGLSGGEGRAALRGLEGTELCERQS